MELMIVLGAILLFILGLVGGLELLDRVLSRPRDPERVLQERFAKGEIDEAEYARRLSVLKLGPPLELD